MAEQAAASLNNCGCSYEWVLPALDPMSHRRLRTCLARWAAGGDGTSRCWQVGRALSDHVHVVVRMPLQDAMSLDELAPQIDGLTTN